MDDIKVLTIGGSKNIGYFSSIRLLDLGATVTFLLRKPGVFDNDVTIQGHLRSGKARLLQGDALVKEDVERAWTAAQGNDDRPVDFLIFTVGGTPEFSLRRGVVMTPPNLVTQCLLNCLETLPTPYPNIIAISSMGTTRVGHDKLPLFLKPVHNVLLAAPHADKRGVEEVLSHCVGWEWKTEDSPGTEILGNDWKASAGLPAAGSLKSVVLIRPAMLTDGDCRADAWDSSSSRKGPYLVEEEDIAKRWSVSRKDVAHFVVEAVVKNWDQWSGKRVSIAY